jgi:SNF family Na+-dependent transporter
MFTLLVRAVTLEGAGEGLLLYVTPDWSKLYTSECWIDSATQIFFAYSIGKKNLVIYIFCFTVFVVYSVPNVLHL